MARTRMKKVARGLGLAAMGAAAVLMVLVLLVTIFPGKAAHAAGYLRELVGPQPVAWGESVVFTVQDWTRQALYRSHLEHAAAPWTAAPGGSGLPTPSAYKTPLAVEPGQAADSAPDENVPPEPGLLPGAPSQGQSPSAGPAWSLPSIPAAGSLSGAGEWSVYLRGANGQPAALRTFLQPDPNRAYAILSLVAFDLRSTRLHFVLGSVEPRTGKYRLSGKIPAGDFTPGRLLAAFNGGFLPANGNYGAMADGITPIEPRAGLATLTITKDGALDIGAWGSQVQDSPNLEAWRQNGPLLIDGGAVTDQARSDSLALWGGTIKGYVVTWRSAVALNRERSVLYYAVGPAMSITTLAQGLLQAGAYQAMQLDINESWTHFTAVDFSSGSPQAIPLVREMSVKLDRYLTSSGRDFFYMTNR